MTDFSGEVLSKAFQYNTVCSTEFDVTISRNQGGYETRNLNRSLPDKTFELGEVNYNREKMMALREFYIRHYGAEISWLLIDWEDYAVELGEVDLVNGEATLVPRLIPGTTTIYRNGSVYNPVEYDLDDDTGLLMLGSAAETGTFTWTGQYYKQVRFNGPFRTELLPSNNNPDKMLFHIFTLPVVQVKAAE